MSPYVTHQDRLDARFDRNCAQPDENGCIEWIGAKYVNGYGAFPCRGRCLRAHRYSYERAKGQIPEGLQLDHLCTNKACVNPEHLEAVTHRENSLRWAALITHCPAGHAYDEANTYRRPRSNHRVCRECKLTKERSRRGSMKGCADA